MGKWTDEEIEILKEKARVDKILQNNEIQSIIKALGVGRLVTLLLNYIFTKILNNYNITSSKLKRNQ